MLLFIMLAVLFSLIGIFYSKPYFGSNSMYISIGLSIPASFIATLAIKFILSKFGSTGSLLYGGKKARWTVRERFAANLSQARHGMKNENYEAAVTAVNEALKHDPKWPEALLIKAQIFHRGFQNREGALRYVKQVISLTPEDDPVNKDAVSLYNDLKLQERLEKRQT